MSVGSASPEPYALPQEYNAGAVEFITLPFRYFLTRHCLTQDIEQSLLKWLESDVPWQWIETDFYEQYEFNMLDVSLPEDLASLASPESLQVLRQSMATIFNVVFDDRVTLQAHKLVPDQRIAIHNDYLNGGETHRLTVQLNRGLRDEDGGWCVLFNSFDPTDIHRIIRPIGGSGLGFEIGRNSYHAVSQLHCGERYTIVYSFYEQRHADLPSKEDQGRTFAAD